MIRSIERAKTHYDVFQPVSGYIRFISMKREFFASNYERVTLLTIDTIEFSSAAHCRSLAWRASRCARYSRSFGAGRCQAGCKTLVRETTIFTSSF